MEKLNLLVMKCVRSFGDLNPGLTRSTLFAMSNGDFYAGASVGLNPTMELAE